MLQHEVHRGCDGGGSTDGSGGDRGGDGGGSEDGGGGDRACDGGGGVGG